MEIFSIIFRLFLISFYFSATCRSTYGVPDRAPIMLSAETVSQCTSEYSDISPLTGANVAFSTLEGRPSAPNFENAPVLQVCTMFSYWQQMFLCWCSRLCKLMLVSSRMDASEFASSSICLKECYSTRHVFSFLSAVGGPLVPLEGGISILMRPTMGFSYSTLCA